VSDAGDESARSWFRPINTNTAAWRANNAFQPTRCASLALQDRWHFGSSTDLSMPYLRSERLNAGR